MFTRESWLIRDKLDLIKSKTVLVIGLGGVGGYTVETLVRAGIGSIIIVDNNFSNDSLRDLNNSIDFLLEQYPEFYENLFKDKKKKTKNNTKINYFYKK